MSKPDIKKVPPQPLSEFREEEGTSETLAIPQLPKRRTCTDVLFLTFLTIALVASILVVIVASALGTDYKRFLNGYDQCGDTCGARNQPNSERNCSGKNLESRPFVKYVFTGVKEGGVVLVENHMVPKECVYECPKPK